MKRKKVVIGLLIAIVSASVAGLSAFRYLQERPATALASEPGDAGSPVVVASRDLALGSVVRGEDVRTVRWPAESVPEGYAGRVEDVVGRGVISDVRANEPLLDSRLADPSGGGGLQVTIPAGMRAVSVRVDEVIGVAGFVLPGTRVDVLLTTNSSGDREAVSRVILQNVRAIAAGQEIQRDEDGTPMTVTVITLLVNLDDAERLVHAAAEGRIQLALRNTLDLDSVETSGSRISSLLSGRDREVTVTQRRVREPESASGEPTPGVIEIYQGGVRTLVSY